jgi:hypothetical protein
MTTTTITRIIASNNKHPATAATMKTQIGTKIVKIRINEKRTEQRRKKKQFKLSKQ